jgi:hypothetical protein
MGFPGVLCGRGRAKASEDRTHLFVVEEIETSLAASPE